MEDIINKIIEIDNLTFEMKKNTERKIKEEKNRTADEIRIIRKEGMKNAKKEAEEKYNAILESARIEVEKINHETDEEYKRIEKAYKSINDKLAGEVLKKILYK